MLFEKKPRYNMLMAQKRNLPIGIQTFEKIRQDNCVYIDKTQFIAELAKYKSPYFLSRPRRFGKSLFVSTLKSYFEGRKDLFEGLAVFDSETEWKNYPVFYFDFNVGDFATENDFKNSLNTKLSAYEKLYGFNGSKTFADRFSDLLKAAHEKTGLQSVVLVDEYDKPLLSAICGISQDELEKGFIPEIEEMAKKNDYSQEECLAELKRNYDGYHFSKDTKTDIYNLFSLMNAFFNNSFGSYWFSTGTPTFLTKMIRDINFDYTSLENDIDASQRTLENYRLDSENVLPMLYQTGYITIKSYDKELRCFTLGLPNEEVKYGLYDSLAPLYAGYNGKTDNIEVLNFVK